MIGGRCFTPGFSDRNYEYLERYAPFFIENGGDLPSHLPPEIQDKVRDLVARAAAALGITDGTVKGDIVVHKGEPYVIELAARLSGGFFCTREIPLNTGVDFIGAAIKVALGETVDEEELAAETRRAGDPALCLSQAGHASSPFTAPRRRARIPGVAEADRHREAGRRHSAGRRQAAVRPPWCWRRARARDAALKAANDALALIRIETA